MMLQEVTCGTRARTEEGTLEESLLGEEKKKKKEDNEQQNFKQSYCCLPTPDNGSHHEVKKQ